MRKTNTGERCGTYSGYIIHTRRKTVICDPCREAQRKYARGHRKKNIGTIREKKHANWIKNKEKIYACQRKWREANPEKVKASQKRHREKYKEHYTAYLAEWERTQRKPRPYIPTPQILANARKTARKRRALKLENGHEPYTEQEVLDLYGTNCHLCELPIDLQAPRHASQGKGWQTGLQIDHVVPLSKGGADTIENVRPSHARCNLSKNNKDLSKNLIL